MFTSTTLLAALSGLGLGLALIAAIGPQNAFVLRQGLRGEHLRTVVAVCVASDVAITAAVVAGAGRLASLPPGALTVVRWTGVVYLAVYAVLAARRAARPRSALVVTHDAGGGRRSSAVLATLALTWLNPHFYVDTLLVLGPVAASYGPDGWAFGSGFAVASTLWFLGMGAAAQLLRPVFARPATWRALDTAVALVMAALAIGVAIRG